MTLALFDLDDTLVDGDCSNLWSRYMVQLGWADEAFAIEETGMLAAYHRGELDMDAYMAFTLAPLKGRYQQEVAREIDAFIHQEVAPRIFAGVPQLLDSHRGRGHRLLIISASGAHLVEPIARRLGIDEVIAIELETENGRYTGCTRGILSYRQGKVTRLEQWLRQTAQTLEGSYFYSDSHNDLPLLEQVTHPRPTNPDPQLGRIAAERNWRAHHWD